MDTKFWGPGAWKFLHSIAFNYPENPTEANKRHYKTLFTNFKFTLPCKYCRESYAEFLQELPIDPYLGSRQKLSMWLYKIHNKVNDKLRNQGNPVAPNPPFSQIKLHYEKYRANCSDKKKVCRRNHSNGNGGNGKGMSLADRMTMNTFMI